MFRTKNKPTILVILDGFGLADFNNQGNAVTPKTAPHIFKYFRKYPSTTLKAHGRYVGLFKNQQGNSEAGHLNIGAGRVVEQDLVYISRAIKHGTFFKNHAFKNALHHAKKYKTNVHIMGLLTDNNSAHARPDHLYALLEFFRRENFRKVFLHLFTDGRDSLPHEATTFLHELRNFLQPHEKIATIMGRFYAMDRNKIWSRTQKAYEVLVLGKGCVAHSPEEALNQSYNRGDTDEYICPTVIVDNDNKPIAKIQDNDVVYFFNARSDRARQITKAFVQKDFLKKNPGAFKRRVWPKNIRFVAMTDFGPDLDGVFTAFPSPDIKQTLPMSIPGEYRQLYISETEKYAHVTYFMNGGYADPVNGENRELIPSPPERSYADEPEMSTDKLLAKLLKYVKNNKYDFITVNFPNPDMVGHTGNFEAAKKAIQIVDKAVSKLVKAVQKQKGQLLIIADHGNAEEMIDLKTGEKMTEHTTNEVPCILISSKYKKVKLHTGKLADVAPTILKMMDIKKPNLMTGKALF